MRHSRHSGLPGHQYDGAKAGDEGDMLDHCFHIDAFLGLERKVDTHLVGPDREAFRLDITILPMFVELDHARIADGSEDLDPAHVQRLDELGRKRVCQRDVADADEAAVDEGCRTLGTGRAHGIDPALPVGRMIHRPVTTRAVQALRTTGV